MRLLNKEIIFIKEVFQKVFKSGDIYLFGSRVDDKKRGGDIDLYIDLKYKLSIKDMLEKKSLFKLQLYNLIGEQKIDVLISQDKNRSIEKEALKTGIKL